MPFAKPFFIRIFAAEYARMRELPAGNKMKNTK